MKKRLLKLTLSAFAMLAFVFSFSSCLGDSDSEYEMTNDFVYINYDESVGMYAINSSGVTMTSDKIKSYSQGDCAVLSYKIKTGSTSGNLFLAENVSEVDRFARADQAQLISRTVPGTIEHQVYPTTLRLYQSTFVPYNYMGDRWAFNLTYNDEANSGFVPTFYYDESAQFEKDSSGQETALKANQVIIDVRFTKYNYNTGEAKAKEEKFVANLNALRTYYAGKVDYTTSDAGEYEAGKKAVPVYIKFRYQTDPAKDPVYLGSSWTSQSGSCFMIFYED
jgi:hypothetical protein